MLTTADTKMKVENSLALLETDVHSVVGCPFTLPGPKPSPCVRIEWTAGAFMCKCDDTKVLIRSSVGKCFSAEGLMQGLAMIAQTQMKARAT